MVVLLSSDYFGKEYSSDEFEILLKNAKKYDGDYRNSIIYRTLSNGQNLSIKEVRCDHTFPKTFEDISQSLAWTELYFVVKMNVYPNYPDYHGWFLDFPNSKLFIVTKWVSNCITLSEYLSQPQDFMNSFCILLQIFIVLEIMYNKFGMIHNDCIPSNILLEKISVQDSEYFLYSFVDTKYYVRNVGYKVYLWDFSYSETNDIAFFDLKNIIRTFRFNDGRPIGNDLKDMYKVIESLTYPAYANNYIYPFVRNWLYLKHVRKTIQPMSKPMSPVRNTIHVRY